MAIANYFYNQTTRKYVAIFGTIFNQLMIKRTDNTGAVQTEMIVPLTYAPFQKVLSRVIQDPDLLNSRTQAISLPRMSFEITNILYDGSRKIASTRKMRKEALPEIGGGARAFLYSPVPYNLDFSLYIMTKYSEDASQLMEQILPFFTPDWTVTAKMVPDLDPLDIPIILNSVTTEDLYEGDYAERQTVLYTLNFTMKAWFFGPEKTKKVIKFIDMQYASDTLANTAFEENVEIFPVLLANTATGWADVAFDDDWIANTVINSPYITQEEFLLDIIPGTANVDLNTSGFANNDLSDGFAFEDLNA